MFFKNDDEYTDDYKKNKKKENFVIVSAVCLAIILFLTVNYVLNVINESKTKVSVSRNNNIKETKEIKTEKDYVKDKLDLSENGGFLKSSESYAYDTEEIRDYILSKKDYHGKKLAFLTFDDGVTPGITDKVLDILKEKKVFATFFVVGKTLNNASKPYLEREINEGHSIAVHSFSHDYSKLYPKRVSDPKVIKEEATKTYKRLKELLGEEFKTHVWRYPGGHFSWKGLDEKNNADDVLKDIGFNWIDWNCLCGDAEPLKTRPTNKEEMLDFMKKSLTFWKQKDVVVVLMHDSLSKDLTVETLPSIIEHFKSQGYEFGILK